MNKNLRLLGVALAVTLPSSAFANYWSDFQDNYLVNPYVSAGGGLNFTNDRELHVQGGGFERGVKDYPGWAGEVAAGVHLPYGFRTELQGGYLHNKVDDVNGFTHTESGGTDRSWKAMWNVLYDLRNPTRFTPYIGGGLGTVWLSYGDVHPAGGTYAERTDELRFAMQAIGGVDYKITDRLSTYLNYEYLAPFGAKDNLSTGAGVDGGYQNHTVTAGLKFALFAPQQRPMMGHREYTSEKTTTTAKSVQTDANSYLVFFDFNSTEVTPEAKRILQTAVDNANRRGIARIVVTGHTDTVGSDAYNMRLSKRRAEAVKKVLVSLGLKSKEISTVGKGKHDLLVPTADGVREPQNRRVEIVYGGK